MLTVFDKSTGKLYRYPGRIGVLSDNDKSYIYRRIHGKEEIVYIEELSGSLEYCDCSCEEAMDGDKCPHNAFILERYARRGMTLDPKKRAMFDSLVGQKAAKKMESRGGSPAIEKG